MNPAMAAHPAKSQESSQSSSSSRVHEHLTRSPRAFRSSSRPLHKTLARTANLANLLPTGTVLGFQALVPSFSNNGSCTVPQAYLTACLIWFFAVICFLSSFTDSFLGPNGKLYYGIATPKGLYVFNGVNWEDEEREGSRKNARDLAKYRVRPIDFVHALVSSLVFLVFSLSDPHVLQCYFRDTTADWNALLLNLPLAVGGLASFLFMLFPTTRKGIGYADMVAEA